MSTLMIMTIMNVKNEWMKQKKVMYSNIKKVQQIFNKLHNFKYF